MLRITLLTLLALGAVFGQTKKIIAVGQPPDVIADWQSVSNKVRVVSVNGSNVMQEIADADGFVGGDITPDMVRAGKKLQWVAVMSAGAYGVRSRPKRSGGGGLRSGVQRSAPARSAAASSRPRP